MIIELEFDVSQLIRLFKKMQPETVSFIRRILSVAETGRPEWNPGEVFFYNDGPNNKNQATLSIGFTASGNLKAVLVRYINRGGSFAKEFESYVNVLPQDLLPKNKAFASLCKAAATDPKFMEVQIECFTEMYMEPAFAWAEKNGFVLELSYLVIADSYLHSGSMLSFLMNKFAEKKPSAGGDEKTWIEQYLKTRHKWLANHSNKILNNTVYRADCYLRELASDNWQLTSDVEMHGTLVTKV